MPVFFCKFHRRIARSGYGNFIHKKNLIEAQPQERTNSRLSFPQIRYVLSDHVVNRIARLDDTVDQFCQESAVPLHRLCRTQCLRKCDIGIGARTVHPQNRLHGQLAYTVDFILTIVLHYAPFSATRDRGSIISSS